MWAVEVIDEGEGKRKEGKTALTKTKIIKQNMKAREAQNHNSYARTTPSHESKGSDDDDEEEEEEEQEAMRRRCFLPG